MYALLRPLLFSLDAETAHHLSLKALSYLPKILFKKPADTKMVSAMGLQFPHALGLAAGLDKNAEHLDALNKLGFSFIEVGTATPKAQRGNPLPRLFRLPASKAIINRMGFNNNGIDALIANVAKSNYTGILGINIGKNKDTPLNNAVDDYVYCLKKAYHAASYITINISSPNTPDLRQLQQKDYLIALLKALTEEKKRLEDKQQKTVPLVVKLSPDEEDEALKNIADILLKASVSGIIATNTTCMRPQLKDAAALVNETGGLSGKPLFKRSTTCLCLLKSIVGSDMTLIASGGIDSIDSAKEKLAAGASLLQVYTGLIYEGPSLIHRLATIRI